jgi:cytoskeletal protein RodZ
MPLPFVNEVAQPTTPTVPLQHLEATTALREKSRMTLVVSLSLVLLVVVGIFSYNLYSPSAQPDTKAESAASVVSSPGASTSLGTGSAAPIGTPRPGTSNGSATDTASIGGTRNQISPLQQFDAKTEEVAKKPSAPSADAEDLRNRTTPVAGNDVTAKHSATDRPVRRYPAASAAGSMQSRPSDGRADFRSDSQRQCTDRVAALGLCSLEQIEERK